jgi:hypothetical protein
MNDSLVRRDAETASRMADADVETRKGVDTDQRRAADGTQMARIKTGRR